MKLRDRTEVPRGAEGAQSLGARGAKPQAPHGSLQPLLGSRRIRRQHLFWNQPLLTPKFFLVPLALNFLLETW